MSKIAFIDELRFLAAQCEAQASGSHRDQDARFIERLAANIVEIGGCAGIRIVSGLIVGTLTPAVAIPLRLREAASHLRIAAERAEAGRLAS